MARYFLRTRTQSYEYGAPAIHYYMSAISDKPNERGSYPTALMHVVRPQSREDTNFEFNKDSKYLEDIKGRLSKHQFSTLDKISKDSNRPSIDLDSISSDELENIDTAAYYLKAHAQDKADYKKYKNTDFGTGARASMRESGIRYAQEIRNLKKINNELFTPYNSGVRITEVGANPSMRHTIPIMGSFFHQQFGELTADHSLSRHSSRLLSSMKKRGIRAVKDNPSNVSSRATNNIDFIDSSVNIEQIPQERNYVNKEYKSFAHEPYMEREVHPAEIAAAEQNLRTILGRPPLKKQLSSQFEQLQFPGMES